ncbi:MEDS domain-containing protein [Actinokineospora bangkokensis]|uniref:STAS domain-containing protein n=1 Tax=Actinokineospora bangkokensis TaxID=1193682 RepID=A0A1Q9LN69_9PSEU|nr:MEDS domain-containing protein [Actinokineospora bangkokensis]OLR93468.1 hypothetical protein BJP25_14260 [Actinokineospora bangkokensis]
MRRHGTVEHTGDLGRADHVCWACDGAEEFVGRARTFLDQGIGLGQQVWLVAPGDPGELTDRLLGTGDPAAGRLRAALGAGGARVVSLDDTYTAGAVVRPDEQVRVYAAATAAAVAAGYTGLRVAADCTELVATGPQLAAFTRYEHRVERMMVDVPFSAMCAYDRGLGERAIEQLSAVHATGNDPATRFRLFGTPGATAGLAGELDLATLDLLRAVLDRADPEPGADGRVVLDVADLGFADHRSLLALADHADRHGATLVLRSAPRAVARVVDFLDVPTLRVAAAA